MIFVLGISFFLMSLIRNQAVTFLLLLGYIAAVLFYMAKKEYYIFDFMSFKMPLVFSHLIGFTSLNQIILQRLVYLLAGLAFISATIFLLKRLPQSRITVALSGIGSVVLLVLSLSSAAIYLNRKHEDFNRHEQMAQLSHSYFKVPTASMLSCNLSLKQGAELSAQADMMMVNRTTKPLEKLIYSLNPGLKIESITQGANKLSFERDEMVVIVSLEKPMQIGDSVEISLVYHGTIDNAVCYLDANKEKLGSTRNAMNVNVNNEFGFNTESYLLLTVENLWYPLSGVIYDATQPSVFKQEFTHFALNVNTQPGLLPFSQGEREKVTDNNYSFTINKPLPQLSLVIGDYVEDNLSIENIDVSLVYTKGHRYFSKYLTAIGDTLNAVLTEFKDNFERPLAMTYPFSKFSIVEVPAQFASLEHSWTAAMANSQPQMVFLPEKGFGINSADFKSAIHWEENQNKRENRGLSEKEMQINAVKRFLQEVFANESGQFNFRNRDEGMPVNPYSIFTNYYKYVNFIQSESCPVINYAIESYMNEGGDNPRAMFFNATAGLSNDDQANKILDGKSLKTIIASGEDKALVNKVLKLKGEYLLTWIQNQVGDSDFEAFLKQYLKENQFKPISHSDFANKIKQQFNVDLDKFIDQWYNESEIPAFLLSSIDYTMTSLDNKEVVVAQVRISNYGKVDGLVKFIAMQGGGRPGPGMQMEQIEKIYALAANETKEIQMVLDEMPRVFQVNTLISKNIPTLSLHRTGRGFRPEENKQIEAVDYARVSDKKVSLLSEGEIVCDNIDPGFSIYDPNSGNVIKNLFKKNDPDEIIALNFWETPSTWKKTVNSEFYGEFEHSAMLVRSGEGDKTAIWTTILDENSYYDVYAYIYKEERRWGRRGREEVKGSYLYTVYSDDGKDEVEIELKDAETGWNLLGTFYFSADSAKVVLSNKSEANRIFADAVRWVKEGSGIKKPKPHEKREDFNEPEFNRGNPDANGQEQPRNFNPNEESNPQRDSVNRSNNQRRGEFNREGNRGRPNRDGRQRTDTLNSNSESNQ